MIGLHKVVLNPTKKVENSISEKPLDEWTDLKMIYLKVSGRVLKKKYLVLPRMPGSFGFTQINKQMIAPMKK